MSFFKGIIQNPDNGNASGIKNPLSEILLKNSSASQGIVFTKGQIIKGEIIDLRGNDIKLILPDSKVVTAKLGNALSLSIGQHAVFQVDEAGSSLVTLKLLSQFESTGADVLTDKALNAADLPKTERNTEAVKALLEQQLPINKESLHRLLQNAATYKNASLSTLTLMTKYNIPMNDLNTTQFEAYRSCEHKLIEQTDKLISSVVDYFEASSTVPEYAAEFFNEFSNILASSDKNSNTFIVPADTTVQNALPTTIELLSKPEKQEQNIDAALKNIQPEDTQKGSEQLKLLLDDYSSGKLKLSQDLNAATLPNTLSNVFASITDNLKKGTLSLRDLVKKGSLKDFFKDALTNHLTLSPEELEEEGAIKKYYDKLEDSFSTLKKALAKLPETSEQASAIKASVSQLSDNVQFMHTLNNIFAYVQLPMQLSKQNANGELFVYTKKEKLRQSPDNISVLLHLDMEHLGPCDIYLQLFQKNISSTFYMEDIAAINVINQNISELNDALAKKGYFLTFEVRKRETEAHIEDFLNDGEASQKSTRRFTFDMRA